MVTPGSIGGNTIPGTVTERGNELKVAVTAEDVAVTVVGTVVPVRSQLVALPARLSWPEIAIPSPVTAVLLLSVPDEAVTGPLPARLAAARLVVPLPALIAPALNVLMSVKPMLVGAVAVTTPPKSLLVLVNVIEVPAVTLVVPVTVNGPVCVTAPPEVSVRLPAVLVPSCVDELVARTTGPVVFVETVP